MDWIGWMVTLKAISGWDGIGWDGMVILYTLTPKASLQSDANSNMENIICTYVIYFWANLFRYFEDFLRGKNPCECVLRPRSEHKGSVLFLVFSQPSSYFSHDLSYLILLQSPIIWSHIFFIISSYIFHNCIIAYILYYIIIQYIISQWHSSHYCFKFFTKTK